VVVLAGAVLDERPPRHRLVDPAVLTAALLWVGAHALSIVDVARGEQSASVLAGDDRWITGSPWLLGALAVLGVTAWCRGCTGARLLPSPTAPVTRGEPARELVSH
jgi:hypothetical protein